MPAIVYRRNPHEPIKLTVCSYEKDARKLCDIPEVADYIRRYARAAKLRDWRSPLFLALEETSRVLLVACDAIERPHPFLGGKASMRMLAVKSTAQRNAKLVAATRP